MGAGGLRVYGLRRRLRRNKKLACMETTLFYSARINIYITKSSTFVKPGSTSAEAILLESPTGIHFKLKIDVTPLRVSLVPFSPNKVERPELTLKTSD